MKRRPRAIITSDSTSSGDRIAGVARSLGYQVVLTRNGLQLLEHLKATEGSHPDDVIVTDLSQGAWIGLYLLDVLVHELCTIRIVAVTSGERRVGPRLRELGVRTVVTDPGDTRALLAALGQRAQGRRQARPMAAVRPGVEGVEIAHERAG